MSTTPDELTRLRAYAEATEQRHKEIRALLGRVDTCGSGPVRDLAMTVLALLDGWADVTEAVTR